MFDATRTTCRIISYRRGMMILFTAEQPVFRVPAARKAWAILTSALLAYSAYAGGLSGLSLQKY
jgi:hypothetical protein